MEKDFEEEKPIREAPPQSDWEKEFDEKFVDKHNTGIRKDESGEWWNTDDDSLEPADPKSVKQFISTLLEQAREIGYREGRKSLTNK